MARNKVEYGGEVLIDLTDSTVAPNLVGKGKVFYGADGVRQLGIARTYLPEDYVDTSLTGMTVLYEASDLIFTGSNYIDTNVALFSEENISKDFRIIFEGLTIDNSKGSGNAGERCLVGSMYEVSPYPGFVVRTSNNAGIGVVGLTALLYCPLLTISRIDGSMLFSAAGAIGGTVTNPKSNNQSIGGSLARVGSMVNCTTAHDMTITLGCEKDKNGNLYRYCGGTIEHIVIAMEE